jgi:hypothetical protein
MVTFLGICLLQNLDFDFEKCCVVSLSPINVYACLVCGKYFQVIILVNAMQDASALVYISTSPLQA